MSKMIVIVKLFFIHRDYVEYYGNRNYKG